MSRFGEVEIDGFLLVSATCARCRAEVRHLLGATDVDGRPLTFDTEIRHGEEFLSVHPCHDIDTVAADPDFDRWFLEQVE